MKNGFIIENWAHKYELTIYWSDGSKRVHNILARNTEVLSMWIPKDENEKMYIVSTSVVLKKFKCEKVRESFLSRGLDIID